MQVDEHSIHAPFMFDFYCNCLKKARKAKPDPDIERIRKKMSGEFQEIPITDLGAPSRTGRAGKTSITKIVRHGITKQKYSVLIQHIIQYFGIKQVIELGTSIGINTLYLAKSAPEGKVYTFEGNEMLIVKAEETFKELPVKNIEIISGNIDKTFPPFLQCLAKSPFLLYIDANHTFEATLRYFNEVRPYVTHPSVIIIDDIHWSGDMEKAWYLIRKDQSVTISADLFQFGLLFFREGSSKQHYTLAF